MVAQPQMVALVALACRQVLLGRQLLAQVVAAVLLTATWAPEALAAPAAVAPELQRPVQMQPAAPSIQAVAVVDHLLAMAAPEVLEL